MRRACGAGEHVRGGAVDVADALEVEQHPAGAAGERGVDAVGDGVGAAEEERALQLEHLNPRAHLLEGGHFARGALDVAADALAV